MAGWTCHAPPAASRACACFGEEGRDGCARTRGAAAGLGGAPQGARPPRTVGLRPRSWESPNFLVYSCIQGFTGLHFLHKRRIFVHDSCIGLAQSQCRSRKFAPNRWCPCKIYVDRPSQSARTLHDNTSRRARILLLSGCHSLDRAGQCGGVGLAMNGMAERPVAPASVVAYVMRRPALADGAVTGSYTSDAAGGVTSRFPPPLGVLLRSSNMEAGNSCVPFVGMTMCSRAWAKGTGKPRKENSNDTTECTKRTHSPRHRLKTPNPASSASCSRQLEVCRQETQWQCGCGPASRTRTPSSCPSPWEIGTGRSVRTGTAAST